MANTNTRASRVLDLLRILLGVVWAANLAFIVVPAADYWNTFSAVAAGYGPSSLGGPGVANYVAANPVFFAWLIAGVTAYLAIAFLLGFSTRLACLVGFVGSLAFLLTQWYATVGVPGGTDIGAHPLYMVLYVGLFIGGAGRYWSVDVRLWKRVGGRWRRLVGWIATPPPRETQ